MNLYQVEKEIFSYFNSGLTVELIGPPGVGKSDTVNEIVKIASEQTKQEWGLSTFMIATSTPIHAMGYMVPSKTEVGTGEHKRSVLRAEYTIPPWMFTADGRYINDFPRGIVFLDEWDKGDADTKKALAPLLLTGNVGPHRLHKGIHVVLASNRAKDRSGSTKTFDFIINRRGELHIQADFGSWERWAMKQGIEPHFIAFAKKYASHVFVDEVPREQAPFCTARSYVASIKWLRARQFGFTQRGEAPPPNYGLNDDMQQALVQNALSGIVGSGVALELTNWLRMRDKTPSLEEIVANPDGVKVPDTPDARTLTMYECGFHITEKNAAPLCKYMKRFPKDLQVSFATYACRRNHMMIANQHMDQFIDGNQALIVSL